MAVFSDYLTNQIVDHLFRSAAFAKPSTLAIALCTAAPVKTDTGALTGKEVANAFSYARVALNPSNTNWVATQGGTSGASSGSGGLTSNVGTVTLVTASGGSWGTVTHVALVDSTTYGAGNLLCFGALTTPRVVLDGDGFVFNASQLQIKIDN